MSYAKLFSSITESSLWSEPKEVRLLFVSMLARADATGFMEASLPGLARLANLTLDETAAAITVLESPDPHSKNQANEGRRLVKVDGGWCLINYEAYRERRSEEERRQYMREYMRQYRGKQNVNPVKRGKPPLAQAEAEAEAEGGSKSPNGRQPSTARMIVLDQELKRIDVKIGDIRNSYDAHQTMDENDREKLKELKAKRAKVRKELGLD